MFWNKKKKEVIVEAEGVSEEMNTNSNKVATGFLRVLHKQSKKNKWTKEEIDDVVMLAFSKTVMTLKNQGLLDKLSVAVEKPSQKDSYFG